MPLSPRARVNQPAHLRLVWPVRGLAGETLPEARPAPAGEALLVQPFRALRARRGVEADFIAPPYGSLSDAEARLYAAANPASFLGVSRAGAYLPADGTATSAGIRAAAARRFQSLVQSGRLQRDAKPCLYAYRVSKGELSRTGLAAGVPVSAIAANRIRGHEATMLARELDCARHIRAIGAETEPVMLFTPPETRLQALLALVTQAEPDTDMTLADGVRHQIWGIDEPNAVFTLSAAAGALPALYIADGHHRTAAALRLARERARALGAPASAARGSLLAVLFPYEAMQSDGYHRIVRLDEAWPASRLIGKLKSVCAVTPCGGPGRTSGATIGLFTQGRWYALDFRASRVATTLEGAHPSLLLDQLVLARVLGISARNALGRVSYAAGTHGQRELERAVLKDPKCLGFALPPLGLDAIMAAADRGESLPAKSTWFEPKLADGLLSLEHATHCG